MAKTLTGYLDLIIKEHREQPNYIATISQPLTAFSDISSVLDKVYSGFDLASAEGQQLDFIGAWVGVDRFVDVPADDVYFSFDNAVVGFDAGIWLNPFSPQTLGSALPDSSFRLLIAGRIANNFWDGTVPGFYSAWANVLPASTGYMAFIEDHGDLTVTIGVINRTADLDITTKYLFLSKKLFFKPAGIFADIAYLDSGFGPMFSFDMDTPDFAGWETGMISNFA